MNKLIFLPLIFLMFSCNTPKYTFQKDLISLENSNLVYDSIYSLKSISPSLNSEIDSIFIKSDISRGLKLFFKGENVNVIEVGCVSSSNYIGCVHHSYSYFVFCYSDKILFIKDYENYRLNVRELKKAFKNEKTISEGEINKLIENMRLKVSHNRYYERTKNLSF